MTAQRRTLFGIVLVVFAMSNIPVAGEDWPQWLGPNRDGSSPEKNLLTTWPKKGPKLLWKVPGGDGYSTVAVAGKQAFTLVQRKGKEWIIALNVANGKELWAKSLAEKFTNEYGSGPRSTPTIENGRVYVQSVSGPLACFDATTGKQHWRHNLLEKFAAKNIRWGLSASPLIDGDLVFAIPGAKGAGVVGFHKISGKLAWKSGSDKAAYSSPVAISVGGKRQIVFFNAAAVLGVVPKTGKELWRIPWKTGYDCNISTPLAIGDRIFVTSGEKVGCAMLQLSASGGPDVVWQDKGRKSKMINYWATSVHHRGHLFGFHGEFDKRISLRCIAAKTGKLKWSQANFGLGAATLADGHLFITTKKGDLILAEANPNKYVEKARVRLLGRKTRTAPTIANGKLFLRDLHHIYCLDISSPSS